MKVLIIGGSGLVGGNLIKLLSKDSFYSKVTATHMNFASANTVYFDCANIPAYIADTQWDIIIHTGALTNVDLCEDEIDLSYKLTVESTKVVLELAKLSAAKFIYISTDYIFDGTSGPYFEDDTVNPLNVYGRHKLEAEQIVGMYNNSLILRITNVYGDEIRKKNFIARLINDLRDNQTLTVNAPIDQFATPVNAYDVAKATDLLIKDNKIGVYHISSTDYMSRVQLLKRLNKYFNGRIKINAVKTSKLKQKALRPLAGGLSAMKFMIEYPNFEFTNIDDYVNKQ